MSRIGAARRLLLVWALGVSLATSCEVDGSAGEPETPTMAGVPFFAPAHEHEPFAEELFVEHGAVPHVREPDGVVLPGDYDARYTHVEDWNRRSLEASGPGPVVWFFGGSSMFGLGQRDEHTIPSEIVALARSEGIDLTAVNFGFPAYLARHEAGLLRRALEDREPPDLIVMLHGVNDMGAVCRSLALGRPVDGDDNALLLEQPATSVDDCLADPERTGAMTADIVDRAMSAATTVAGSVPVLEFWQPFAGTRRPTAHDDALMELLGADERGRLLQGEAYRSMIASTGRPVTDLSGVMDDDPRPVYFDWVHTNELGARLIATAMWASLRDQVRALSG